MTRQEKLIQAFSTLAINSDEIFIDNFEGTLCGSIIKGSYVETLFDSMKKITLFHSVNNKFFISYYDDRSGEEVEFEVSENDSLLIPDQLKNMMKEVTKSKKPKTISKSSIEYLNK